MKGVTDDTRGPKADQIHEQIVDMIRDVLCMDGEINDDQNLARDLMADELDLEVLAIVLEDEFFIVIPSEEMRSLATVADIVRTVKTKVAAQSQSKKDDNGTVPPA